MVFKTSFSILFENKCLKISFNGNITEPNDMLVRKSNTSITKREEKRIQLFISFLFN